MCCTKRTLDLYLLISIPMGNQEWRTSVRLQVLRTRYNVGAGFRRMVVRSRLTKVARNLVDTQNLLSLLFMIGLVERHFTEEMLFEINLAYHEGPEP